MCVCTRFTQLYHQQFEGVDTEVWVNMNAQKELTTSEGGDADGDAANTDAAVTPGGETPGADANADEKEEEEEEEEDVLKSITTPEQHLDHLVQVYVEGLEWVFQYYYQGCVSWKWYYPYRYAPLASDMVGLGLSQRTIEFELGKPFKPFQQLLGTLPPSSARFLPPEYRRLMLEERSPILDYYPLTFEQDMNGKRNPWEAVVIIPFINEDRLLAAIGTLDQSTLTAQEKLRNSLGNDTVYSYDEGSMDSYPSTMPHFPNIECCNSKMDIFTLPDIPVQNFEHEGNVCVCA